jgi:uncharacterized protein (TIGR03437 family)
MKRSTYGKLLWACLALALFVLSWLCLSSDKEVWLGKLRSAIAPLATAEAEADELEHEHTDRLGWFYAQRAYPRQTLPLAARRQAIEQLSLEETRLRKRGVIRAAQELQQTAWQPLGPAPIGEGQTYGVPRAAVSGRVSTIVLDPGYNGTSNQTVYLGAALGGVWRSRDNGATWAPLTDYQPSLAMGAIAIDPTNPNIIYVGTGEGHRGGDSYYGAGLLKTTDGGATWTQITGPVSTTNPQQPAFLNATFMALVINPTTPSTIYAATNIGLTSAASGGTGVVPIGNRGIWKSTDSGQTWRNLNPANSEVDRSATDVLLDPQNPERVFATILNLGIYRSNAGGGAGSWERLAGGLPDAGFTRIELAVGPPLAPSTNLTLYAAFAATDENLLGIYKSTNEGANWTKVTTPQLPGQASYNLALAVDPADANIIYYGTSTNNVNNGGTLWRSRDGGQSWTDLSSGNGSTGGLHADTHWIAISPSNRNILFTANDGGVWRTDNATGNVVAWTNLNQVLSLTQFQTIALHPTNPNILLGGTQDNGTNRYDGNPNWFQARGGDGGFALIDQANPQVMYHTFFNQNNADGQRTQIGPEISFNGGNTWARRGCFSCNAQAGGFNPADRVAFYAPMAQHTAFTGASGNVIYFGTHRLYRSADQGLTWMGLGASVDGFGADLTKNVATAPSYITAIAAHPSLNQSINPPGEVVWVGTGDGLVQLTTDAGALAAASFTNVTRAPLPNRYVTDIALDPNNQQRAFVTYSGFNTSTPGHVFMTNDQGATWADISGNLPDVPVNSVALDPLRAGVLFIGTDIGVFQTTDGGATWLRVANGLPNVAVLMLRYHAVSRTLVAATHGRGVYRLALPSAVVSVSAASFTGTTLASEAIVAAFGVGLATTTQVAASLPLPTELAGARVVIRDGRGVERAAPLFFVAPTQINYQMPSGLANDLATVTVTSGSGTVSLGAVQLDTVAPGLFAANANGQGVAAAVALRVKADGSQSFEPVAQFDGAQNRFVAWPIELGPEGERVFLLLFGTGLRHRSALSNVSATLSGTTAVVSYAGAQGDLAGLDQVNLEIPRSLSGRGEIDVLLAVDGKTANTVRVSIR